MLKWIAVLVAVFLCSNPARATIDASLQMQLGNPSGATADPSNTNHFLIQRTVEAMDFSDALGEPLWVSWDLTIGDVGNSGRSQKFFTDTNLPHGFYEVTPTDYNGVGNIHFDRGHMCPSEDRTDNTNDNDLVFLMSNIIPQAATNNEVVWASFEDYCRTQAQAGNELLIMCGPSGFGTTRIPSGKAVIPDYTWKIAVIVPLGAGTAASRITANTRVITLKIPNINTVSSVWSNYITSASQIESDTGFTFFTALSPSIASALRSKVEGQSAPAPSITSFSPASGAAGTNVVIIGTFFTSATTVAFNGVPALFTVNSSTQITATVPANASTGKITVSTASSTAISGNNFLVNGAVMPSLTLQPQDQAVSQGQSATFTVMASGTAPLAYQWQYNGNAISGANATNFTVANTQFTNIGFYSVVVTNVYGAATSSAAALTITNGFATILAQWNFNNTNANSNAPPPSFGSGTITLVGGITVSGFFGGSSTDPASTNSGWNTTTYGVSTTGNKSRGVRFNVNAAGYQNLSVSWDERVSPAASKYFRLQYTTNGTDFIDSLAATTMNTNNVFESKTNNLAAVAAVNNNSNFAFRIVSEFESSALNDLNAAYVTTSTNAFNTAGTVRYDMVTLYGFAIPTNVPPPSLSGAGFDSGQFGFIITGVAGFNYVVQGSTNLVDWISLQTNAAPFSFADTNNFSQRFYRAQYLP